MLIHPIDDFFAVLKHKVSSTVLPLCGFRRCQPAFFTAVGEQICKQLLKTTAMKLYATDLQVVAKNHGDEIVAKNHGDEF